MFFVTLPDANEEELLMPSFGIKSDKYGSH